MQNGQIFCTNTDGVRFRSSPDAASTTNILRGLPKGQQVIYLNNNGIWFKVQIGNDQGWIRSDFLTPASPTQTQPIQQQLPLIKGVPNLFNSPNTIAIRAAINDEFHGGTDHLNCTEYAEYRVKTKLGITINWPIKLGRNGGLWWKIFQDAGRYKVLTDPTPGCSMSFTAGISTNPATNAIGHVAFVEDVLPGGSISISEANWPPHGQLPQGQYSERIISKDQWQNQYKAKFVQFS